MRKPRGIPPGRSGRLWLRRRIAVADRAADVLGLKLHLLREEQHRLHAELAGSSEAWEHAAREADAWLIRASLIGGQRSIRLAVAAVPAAVSIERTTAMGVRYPVGATVTPAPARRPSIGGGSVALVEAVAAHRLALDAAVRQAVAEAAVRVVDAEVEITAMRRRAVEERWIPALSEALAQVELALEEGENADAVVRRWAASKATSTAGQAPGSS